MQVRIALALDPDLLQRVDQARGDIPRARFIQRALEASLSPNGQNSPDPQREVDDALAELKREEARRRKKDEWLEPAKPKKKPDGCHNHPGAGSVTSRGRLWCAEPGCGNTLD